MKQQYQSTAPTTAGWRPADWLSAVGISKPTEQRLPESMRPKSVKVGRRRVIIEAPEKWLKRVARNGGTQTKRPAG